MHGVLCSMQMYKACALQGMLGMCSSDLHNAHAVTNIPTLHCYKALYNKAGRHVDLRRTKGNGEANAVIFVPHSIDIYVTTTPSADTDNAQKLLY